MKKILVCLAMTLLLSSQRSNGQENLIQNGDFREQLSKDGFPFYWTVHPQMRQESEGEEVQMLREHEGDSKEFLRISKRGGKDFAVCQILSEKSLAVARGLSGAILHLRGEIRGSDLDEKGANVRVLCFSSGAEGRRTFSGQMSSDPISGKTDWRRFSLDVDIGSIIDANQTLEAIEVALVVSSDSGHVDFSQIELGEAAQ